MLRPLSCLVLALLVACQPPWLAPRGHIQSLAWSKQEAFNFIKAFHDRTHQTDPMKMVYQATILKTSENDLAAIEAWVVGAESGLRFEYTLLIGHQIRGRKDLVLYAVVKVEPLGLPPS